MKNDLPLHFIPDPEYQYLWVDAEDELVLMKYGWETIYSELK